MPDKKRRFPWPLKRSARPAASGKVADQATTEPGDMVDGQSSNGSTGDQIGGQSSYSEDEMYGRTKGLPKK